MHVVNIWEKQLHVFILSHLIDLIHAIIVSYTECQLSEDVGSCRTICKKPY